MQDFACVVDDEYSLVLSIFIVGYIYIIRIHIVKVYFPTAFFGDTCCEHDINAGFLDAVDESADPFYVRRVSDYPARDALELVHSLEKIVAGMVADLVEPFAVRV